MRNYLRNKYCVDRATGLVSFTCVGALLVTAYEGVPPVPPPFSSMNSTLGTNNGATKGKNSSWFVLICKTVLAPFDPFQSEMVPFEFESGPFYKNFTLGSDTTRHDCKIPPVYR